MASQARKRSRPVYSVSSILCSHLRLSVLSGRVVGNGMTHGMHTNDSNLCATCHNLKTPFVDADGNLASSGPESEFAEQMPYTEWEYSDFGPSGATPLSCLSCHKPETDGVKLANHPVNLQPANGFSRRQLVGANTTILDILDRNRATLGVTTDRLGQSMEQARPS